MEKKMVETDVPNGITLSLTLQEAYAVKAILGYTQPNYISTITVPMVSAWRKLNKVMNDVNDPFIKNYPVPINSYKMPSDEEIIKLLKKD
jgi:hypothetical protein